MLLLPLAVLASCSSDGDQAAPPPPTTKVVRETVATTVGGNGVLQYLKELKLNFPVSGRVTAFKVGTGDQVAAGQVLATLENTEPLAALRKAQGQLAISRAALGRVKAGNQAKGGDKDVRRSQDILDSTKAQADEIDQANDTTIKRAQKQLDFDRAEVQRLQDRLPQDQADDQRCENANTVGGVVGQFTVCERVEHRQDQISDARRRVLTSKTELDAAKRRQDQDRAAQRLAADTAQRDLTSVKNAAELAASDRPFNIEEQQGLVAQAEAEVQRAQTVLDSTILKALVPGRIAAVNGNIGQYVAVSSGLTVVAGADDPNARPSRSDAVIVEDGVNTFQVRLSMSELDTLKLQPGQPADLTFDSLPGFTQSGTVSTIEPVQNSGGAGGTSFTVTVVLNAADPQLKDGMSAKARIITDKAESVLVVPKTAVKGIGRATTVTKVAPDGSQREVPVEVGVVGDTLVEIKSGVNEGDMVATRAR